MVQCWFKMGESKNRTCHRQQSKYNRTPNVRTLLQKQDYVSVSLFQKSILSQCPNVQNIGAGCNLCQYNMNYEVQYVRSIVGLFPIFKKIIIHLYCLHERQQTNRYILSIALALKLIKKIKRGSEASHLMRKGGNIKSPLCKVSLRLITFLAVALH